MIGLTPSPAKADPQPDNSPLVFLQTLDLVQLAAVYANPGTTDPQSTVTLRLLILWVYWTMGGDPAELDPTWAPPVPNP